MKRLLTRLALDQRGATAIEYGLIASLIVIASVTAIQAFADETIHMWQNVDQVIGDAEAGAGVGGGSSSG